MSLESFKTSDGDDIYSYDFVQNLRRSKSERVLYAQAGCQEKFLATHADLTIFGGSRGGGKGGAYDSLVLTPYGFRRMGDLQVGDNVNSIYGSPQKIISITELGNREVYELKFSDGTSAECTDDHLWNIKRTNSVSKLRKNNNLGQEFDWRLWTFKMIKEHLDKNKSSNLLIPLCKPQKLSFPIGKRFRPSKITPYMLGAFIGDGCFTGTNNSVLLSTMDRFVIDEIEREGLCFQYSHKVSNKTYQYIYKDNVLREDLVGLKLYGLYSHEKFIPDIYKYGTIETRFSIVQGLMDTDGYIDKRGHCSYSTTSKKLAEDLAFVLRSLGAYVTISEKKKSGYKRPNGDFIECKESYNLYIKMEDETRLFRLPRRKARCTMFNGGVSSPTKRIIGYEFVGYKPCRCISVSNVEGLYMTNDFIVTHNSFALLVEALKDVYNPYFNAIILREEKPDLENLIDESNKIYEQYGKYNRSKDDMTWNFNSGGRLHFGIYSQAFSDFTKKYQGKQYAYIGIDEITHIPYKKFKYLITDNRNAHGIRNRVYGTCNPDPDSWVRKFIDWWIGDDGYPIEERDGVIRYCFMEGNTPNSIIWGDTPQEVYRQCKRTIDSLWKPSYEDLGFNKLTMFVKSVCFIYGKLEENVKLLESDPNYIANLAQQSEEQRGRDLGGNWNIRASGNDMISREDMEVFFKVPQLTEETSIRRASCDIAFTGGDSLVMWLWNGWHIEDIFVCRNDPKTTIELVRSKLNEWGVREEFFTYDLNGLGQTFKGFFPKATPFNNMAAPIPRNSDEKNVIRSLFGNLKSECSYMFADKLKNGEISINPDLLEKKFSGDGFERMPLNQILLRERKAIRQKEETSDKGFSLIDKKTMKRYVGHSPDYIEALLMVMIFELTKLKKRRNIWML